MAHDAAKAGDVKSLHKILLQAPEQLNKQDKFTQTCLHLAAFSGHVECVQKLLELGANVNVEDRSHFTPLHSAASASDRTERHLEICRVLLLYGISKSVGTILTLAKELSRTLSRRTRQVSCTIWLATRTPTSFKSYCNCSLKRVATLTFENRLGKRHFIKRRFGGQLRL